MRYVEVRLLDGDTPELLFWKGKGTENFRCRELPKSIGSKEEFVKAILEHCEDIPVRCNPFKNYSVLASYSKRTEGVACKIHFSSNNSMRFLRAPLSDWFADYLLSLISPAGKPVLRVGAFRDSKDGIIYMNLCGNGDTRDTLKRILNISKLTSAARTFNGYDRGYMVLPDKLITIEQQLFTLEVYSLDVGISEV